MITDVAQRWNNGAARYRPAHEVIRPSDYEVAEILGDGPAKAFVQKHHYSGSYPAARFRFGLYRAGKMVGVAVFSHPSNNKVLTNIFPGDVMESVELGRLVLSDSVPGNGESWMIARCFEILKARGILGVVSFSDPEPRTTLTGDVIFKGHLGTIYMASNACYQGRATARILRILPDGSVLSERTLSKIRAGDRGWQYGAAILQAHGATPLNGSADAWLKEWLPRLTRPLRHAGNHKYAWILPKRSRHFLPPSLPYPRVSAAVSLETIQAA